MNGEERTEPCDVEPPNRYRYQALDTSTRQIRLIKLHPGQPDKPQCGISVFELDNAPPFLALSYTWGPPSPQFDILVNGEPLSVRENLFRFLQAYLMITDEDSQRERLPGCYYHWESSADEYLWIDQICIDQSSVSERNHQVGMMASIYSGCCETIIWLGSIPSNPDAPCMIKKMGRSSAPVESVIQAVASILKNGYFTRLWIVQEIILSKRKRVLCSHRWAGAVWLDWTNLAYIARRFQHRLPSTPAMHLVKDHPQGLEFKLIKAVRFFSKGQCHDPRDKVYGLMGLVQEDQRLTIDYAKPLEELFVETMNIFYRGMRDSASTYTEYQEALLSLAKPWGIMSESLIAFLYEIWEKPPYDWHQRYRSNGSAFRVYPAIHAMGFLLKGPEQNIKLKAKELLPYSMDAERYSGDYRTNDWVATEDCWWYQTVSSDRTEEAIYYIYGLVSSNPLVENPTPGYYCRRVRKAQQESRIRIQLPSWAVTRRSFRSA